MKKLVVLLVVLAMAGSAFAFAASFTVNESAGTLNEEDISSGSQIVNFCNGNVEVDINGGAYHPGINDFVVGLVDVNLDDICAGSEITLQLTAGGAAFGPEMNGIANAAAQVAFDFTSYNLPVGAVTDVHVMVESVP